MERTRSTGFLTDFSEEKKAFGYYLLGSLIVIFFSFLGQIPMFFFLPEELPLSDNPMDLFAHLDSNLTLILFLFPFLIAFLGFIFVVNKIHNQRLVSVTTGRSAIDFKRMFFGFAFWGVISVSIVGIDLIVSPEDYIWNFQTIPFVTMLIVACCLIPFQSALEEWLFRGYLMQGFATLTNSRFVCLLMTSVIFGLLHVSNPEIDKLGYGLLVYYIGTGFFFGIMSLMDDGIELAIGFHVANNLITAVLVTADWTAFQTESLYKDISTPALGQELILFLLVIYPLSLFYLGKKYQWKNWKSKLIGQVNAT